MVIMRDSADLKGKPDLFLAANRALSENALVAGNDGFKMRWARVTRRALGQRQPLPGEEVLIQSRSEIEQTLDADGRLEGLPFMPEMAQFCGRRARVFRCVDKVYDYGGKKTLRRIKNVVLLAALRCDGTAHGGCQAGCYLLWKTAWLRPVDRPAPTPLPAALEHRPGRSQNAVRGDRYTCQFTELVASSTPMHAWDVRQDLRPLLAGNVSVRAFCVAVLTRIFNAVQEARGGVGYPSERFRYLGETQPVVHDLAPGDRVRVRSREQIFATLDKRGRLRGLWFDADMVKHCGRPYTVLKRVQRIIDDATGQMVTMKNVCLVLDGVDSSGEFLRFCPQHEHPFWREEWLVPQHVPSSERRA
jgi:hypothetical protein